ncbi:hypothetical protein Tco_0938303 [Tanacetum coccineum]|uniref:Reverse transcriptase domain-containing protein n=1 Tax=Tanacetum coccineum TaxID=301880 RepID=A0ABQ5DHR0_9ASTR
MEKIFQIFQDLRFDISFMDALLLMPRFAPTIKSLLMNKEKLLELAKIPLNENCSTMLLKKLPGKLGDPDKFLIPCNLPGMDLSLPELYTTQMTLELADDQLLVPSKGSTEDFVKVGNFHFPTDFVVVDFEADPRVPLILGRSFLRTSHVINEKEKQEVKNLAELMAKRQIRITPCLNNFKVICKESIFHSNKPPQVSSVFAITSTLPSIEPKDSLMMGDDNLTIEVPTYNEGYYDLEGDVTYLESLLSNDTTHNLSPEVFFDHEPQQLKNEPENEPLITFSPKSDPLHHEFTGELITISTGIFREHEDYINRMSLLCSNSSSVTEKFSYIIESLPNLYFSENSDPNREEIDIFSEPDDSIPPGIESDFDSEEDIIDNLLNGNPTHERLTFNIEPDAPVINNVDKLNEDECFDPGGGENNVEVDDSFIFVTWNFLPFLTYPEEEPKFSKDSRVQCADIAKISRKRSKPDKHGYENRIECARAGRMLSKERFYNSAGILSRRFFLIESTDQVSSILTDSGRKLKDGGEVKEFHRSFCHSDTERLSRSDKVLKLKNFKKDATLKFFSHIKSGKVEHVGLRTSPCSQGWQSTRDANTRLCLVDDLKVFKFTISLTCQDKGTSSCLKSKDTTTYSQDKRHKVYELKTKDKSIVC